ncbi:hypothetical protein P691DRAFT_810964 [Macrolepiota fuliginosa MF-IS2]|uniref:Uncharacterized protein n=1 Tax=Macrolepiota fuliginosa MF-IS2 TaxID=1400762 RepID=A0A9P6C5V9_9AGAR|nr:hypothetical protein P691DRAFT_810964 [Macrolepiota fuliginosa MF-IS2]
MQRLRAHECWVLDTPLAFRLHPFKYAKKMKIKNTKLLPGGQWLLATSYDGCFYAYDLCSPRPRPHRLFNPGKYDEQDKTLDDLTSFAIWVGPSAETLSFRVNVWRWSGPKKAGYVTRTFIYQVSLSQCDGENRLVAEHMYTARSYLSAHKPGVALSDRLWAEVRSTGPEFSENLKQELFLYQYTTDGSGELPMDDIRVELGTTQKVYELFITSHGHIVAAGRTFVEIYTISQLRQHDTQRKLSSIYRVELGSSLLHVCVAPFLYRGFTWIIFQNGEAYQLVRLSHDSQPPLVKLLGHCAADEGGPWHLPPPLTGETAAVALQRDWTMDILTYSWDVEMSQCAFRVKRTQIPKFTKGEEYPRMIGADVISGRVVLLDIREKRLVILDTA